MNSIKNSKDDWYYVPEHEEIENKKITYRCKKRGSLFKYEYKDGRVKYIDVNRCYCTDINNNSSYSSSLINSIFNRLFPISMPYIPPIKPINVFCEKFLSDQNNGDFDTVGIFYIVENNKKTDINKFFKCETDGLVEIDRDEYDQRKILNKFL